MDITRRRLLVAGAAMTALCACGRPDPQNSVRLLDSEAPLAVSDQLAALEDRYNARVGFYGRNMQTNRTLGRNEDDLFATCSAFKAYVAGAILQDPRDTSTPRTMGTGFANMLTGDVFDEPHRAQLWEWMSTITTGDTRIRAGLPPGWGVADKTGAGDYASTNDIGVAFGPNGERLILSVMTRTRSDDPKTPALNDLIADVTRVVVPALLV